MKTKMILLLTLLVATSAHAGLSMTCDAWPEDEQKFVPTFALLGGLTNLNCHDKQGNQYSLTMIGAALGMELTFADHAWVNCPLVNKKRILAGTALTMLAPKISAALGAGAQAAVAVNYRGAVCFMGGVSLGGGGAIQLDLMTIEANSDSQIQWGTPQ